MYVMYVQYFASAHELAHARLPNSPDLNLIFRPDQAMLCNKMFSRIAQ